MDVLNKPILNNEKSYSVKLLHQALTALGMPIAKNELSQGKAGQHTVKQVRALQARLNMPVDDSVLVDKATALAIAGALRDKGLTTASRSFTIAGAVRARNGVIKKRHQLMAFDLDLRGVAVYRNIKKLAEIGKNGGFEFLGQTTTDSNGNYRITFYDWQYATAERKKSDVVVYAVEGGEIIGHSRMVSSENYSDKGLVSNLDVILMREEQGSEYQRLMDELTAFLKENKVGLKDIAKSEDQLTFTASELDIGLANIKLAASAELMVNEQQNKLSHELLYGLGRQNIRLSWTNLYKKSQDELRGLIEKSAQENIIQKFSAREINAFLQNLHKSGAQQLLNSEKSTAADSFNAILKNALPEEEQRLSFATALSSYDGDNFKDFWNTHLPKQPEFKDKPELVKSLLLTQQLTLLSGNHQALVNELQGVKKITSVEQLAELEKSDWKKIVKKAGVPESIAGANDAERIDNYVDVLYGLVSASYPTRRLAKMVKNNELGIEKNRVSKAVGAFLAKNREFDFANSRVHNFDAQIKAAAGEDYRETRDELMTLQRVFQVSANPESMTVLKENKLTSAHAIAGVPRKSFIKTHGKQLGGENAAFAIHQRAEHIANRSELAALHIKEYADGLIPGLVLDKFGLGEAQTVLKNQVPNYAELFGSPDVCECKHCRSVYSAAAYFVDLLRFLWRGEPNSDGKTPLDRLAARRPDLLHLPLTCENTNTIIPYIDLANEVMEYYTANGSLNDYQGYNTGEVTAEELRANPQNVNIEAYRKLNTAKYPFNLPYHQPLDVIRTYSDHLNVSRHQAMKALNPQPDASASKALHAEVLRLSQEQYRILSGEDFDGAADGTALHAYFGYNAPGQLGNMSQVREFLRRAGIAYTDLVELVKTQFINPYQYTLDFLQAIFSHISIDANAAYNKLVQIDAGTLNPAADTDITSALNAYNAVAGTDVTPGQFGQWVNDHLAQFQQVITLYEPNSRCDLDTTTLKTVEKIYTGAGASGITNPTWSKTHRFIRLWKKLGWSIHETDLVLAALGKNNLDADVIGKLASASLLHDASKRPLNELAVLWGNIDTYGDKSLYKKLFLNKSVQRIDAAFTADAWGNYLQDPAAVLGEHQSAILAALRITEEDLSAIYQVARVIDAGNPRPLDPATDSLNLANLSTLYRHVVLAKALKMRVADLCKLIALFDAAPFSRWDIQQSQYLDIAPAATYAFYQLAAAVKAAGFKPAVLEYILQGTLPADSSIGLDRAKTLQTAKNIRDAFAVIEQEHPLTPAEPLTADTLAAKLSLTFQPQTVARFMAVLDGTASFEAVTDANLDVTIPNSLANKYRYVKGSGRLTAAGVMSDAEQAQLKGLANVNANFQAAVDRLYTEPETWLSANFNGVFSDLAATNATLLDHPAQATAADLDAKLTYVYQRFIPLLKNKLRRDAITQHIAALIGLGEATTALLIAGDLDNLMADLATEGFSASYYNDASWNVVALEHIDSTIDFDWGGDAPHPGVPANNFSARWQSYLAAPASGEYTLVVDVQEADESFNLYLDDTLILQKAAGDATTRWEVVVQLNAAQLHRLTLDYAETAQNAGVQLRWKTATTALDVVPAGSLYPAAILDSFAESATVYHRAAKGINGFALSDTELAHFIDHAADFGNIDFQALTIEHWQRLRDYTELRNAVPQAQALLTDLFAQANTPSPVPTVEQLAETLHLATAWDKPSLNFLIDDYFGLGVDDFKNEIAIKRLHVVMEIVSSTGLSAATIAEWGRVETDFDALNDTAQLLKNTVKAKYEEEDWLDVAGDISDKIREHQKQALISYLLMQPAIRAWDIKDADGLFEYFLIDVQMGSCMDTSRIVQANSSIQMFVNRCLLNLESELSSGAEKGVSPGAIDKDRWQWMKNYRVWEANRKVFLYPENWLEPEWRNDRSEFFRDLESYLVQNDITERSAEQAFRNYLANLNEVANLDVCGTHRENYSNGSLKYLHVFARGHNAPYKFYYRRWNEYRKWSAWEKVPLDIRGVEGRENSGVHLVPVVWKNRLFLFWPEFMLAPEAPGGTSSKSVEEVSDDSMSSLEANEILEVRMAWSEYLDGKWTPKQVTKEYVREWPHDDHLTVEKDFLFTPGIDASTQELTITISDNYWNAQRGRFRFSDIQSPVRTEHYGDARFNTESTYDYHFARRKAYATLELTGDLFLKRATSHKLLPVDTEKGADIDLDSPFFFSDALRTYFVRPVTIKIIDGIKFPDLYRPYIPEVRAEWEPFPIPDIGPDDFLPIDEIEDRLRFGGFGGIGGGGVPTYHIANNGAGEAVVATAVGMESAHLMERRPMMMRSSTAVAPNAAEVAAGVSGAQYYMANIATVDHAFGVAGNFLGVLDWVYNYKTDTGLEFNTFYHPYSSNYVKRLNQGGLPGLLASDTVLPSDNGVTFENAYDPNFVNGYVQKAPDDRTYYKENVCFDVYGANSLYNWELFFHAPLYIATRLSKNGKYEEAMKWFHYIFDPTTDALPGPGESEVSRYWKVAPFKKTAADDLKEWLRNIGANTNANSENAIIGEWRDNPFDPHLVASNRPLAYMKNVVLKYVENLIAWGDSLFRQDTMESVNEALQLYVIANHILGPYPEFVPQRGAVKAETYHSLRNKWDDFSNALVALENIFPYSSEATVSSSSTGANLLGIGASLYFCIPSNEKLLEHWDTVADRLFKIRHCQNIDGVERKLALFAPPIDPAALIQATSQGLSLGSILADLSSPPPIYRFRFLIQKANEFCNDVKALGSALLSALEKKDSEELNRLRASHETHILELTTAIRERQLLDAKANRESLLKARDSAVMRIEHYAGLLGHDGFTVPAAPAIAATLTADSQLPVDTSIAALETDVDESLVDSGESGVKLIPKEKEEVDKSDAAKWTYIGVAAGETLAGVFNLFPQVDGEGTPLGVGVGAWWGGQNLGAATMALAKAASHAATFLTQEAAQAARMSAFIRREQDWTLQGNLAIREIIRLDKQITSADIRIQAAEKELQNHKQRIENAKEVELFLQDKFSNQELYQWLKEQLFAVYKQSYNLAYDMAKKCEKAYKYERGLSTANFIQYGYWDNARQGLTSGEKLQLALRQLEKAYLEENRRELELSKSVSLALVNPLALIELRETGKCYLNLPEELFDLDFQGHYFRRIKSVSLSIPCIAGPFTSVNCSLRLLNNSTRINTSMNSEGKYEHEHDEGLLIDDDRFRTDNAPVTSIATSKGQNDAGVFEFNFRDERYLPFEGAGAISEWQIELTADEELRQFDYSTITDVILQLNYSARENGGLFKEKAVTYIKDYIANVAELSDQPLLRMFSLKQEFPTEWHQFFNPAAEDGEQIFSAILGKDRFPFFVQGRDVVVMKADVFAKCAQAGDYHLVFSNTNRDGDPVTSAQISVPQNNAYGGINKATINVNDAGLNLEELDIDGPLSLKLKHNSEGDYTALSSDPREIEDLFVVLHYKLG